MYNNTVRGNVHDIRFSVGSRDNVVGVNTFEDNQGYDIYQYAGSDPVVEVESGNPTNDVFFANAFSGNTGGARLDNSVDTQFSSNIIGDWTDFEARDSNNTLVLGNTFPTDMRYTFTGSCINSASDIQFGDICSNAAITNPYNQNGLLGTESVAADVPFDSQTASPTPIFTTTPTGSVMFTASPTVAHRLTNTATPSMVLPLENYDTECDDDRGNRDSSRELMSMPPTPNIYASYFPVTEIDDTAQDSNGSTTFLVHTFIEWIGHIALMICLAV